MAPNQLPTTGPTGKQWARSPANKVTNYLTLSIALVTLIAVAYATSTPLQQQHKQQQHLQQQQQRLVSSSSASQSSLLSPHKPHTPHSVLKRSPSSTFENFEPLYERPRAYSNVAPTQNEDSQNFDETDEEFLRQLKEAASYLDDKLAERQRQQQQLAILNQAPGFGRRLLESIGHTQQQQRPQQQQQLAYGYREPTYGVLVDPQVSASSSAGRASSASGWPNSNENDNLAEAENDTTEDPEAGETNVVVIAPGHGTSRLISSSPNQVADYRLLTDQLQQDQNQQQQQQSFTDAKYKQLLKSILLDQAQANSLASLSPTENSKRDSRGDGPAAKSIDDSTKTEQQQQQSQQPEEQQQEQQQQPDQGSAAKYTTLLEDEQESSPVPTAASAKPGEPAEVKARELTSAPAYGTLVYDQTAQRPAVRDGSTSTSSSPWVVGSMLKRLYCNVVYYLPFLNQLTNWFLPSCQGNKVDTSAEGTTTRGSQVHVAESKRQQQGISIGIGSNSNEGNGRQQQQSIDNGLHAKANVSVSLLVNHSEEAKENHKEISDHDAKDGMLENNGETNKQQQRVSGDESAANDDDGANQDNQQSQTNDKEGKLLLKQQPQLLKHGLKNVKVTVDRKKTNDDDTEEEEAEKANNNNIKDNHYDDAIDDDHFSGQFVNNGNNGAEPSAAAAQDDSVQHQRQRASKSWDLKRDRAPQSFVIENDNDMDMSQMVPAEEVGHRPRYTTTDNDDADDDENDEAVEHDQLQVASSNNNNGYNMMKHSNLLVPIGSASDVPIRTSSNSIRQQQQPDSLLGKYIYAPTQHYYLNSMIPSAALVGSGGGPNSDVGGPFSHQHRVLSSNGGKHIQPGDTIYGSYGGNMPMKAAYAYQSEHTSIGNKPSDLYFLVMVGAFCVMAMAVVLAAGLFAYRIQQNRKSSQDTDYPTYGVVGPNNMSAKCGGAASFVGGYFTGPPSGSSKSGSAKHLPDLYGTPNGAGGSDSGLNSLDKSSSNKKAASVSSLNEQHTHQSANSRTASSNFMAAASQDAARMYHYQHQKQQMIISDRNSGGRQTSASDLDSEDENDDGSYTVYECPGLASAHEMEIKNPLFNDDQSP